MKRGEWATEEKNWPCKACPFARNAIDVDIPRHHRKSVQKFYNLWKLTVLCLFINLISLALYPPTSLDGILLSVLYIWTVIPLSWLFIFKRFYRAMQGNTSLGYLFWISLGMFLIQVLRSTFIMIY